jgi:hypothetical protein
VRWGNPERLPKPTSPSRFAGPSLSPLKGEEGFLQPGKQRCSVERSDKRPIVSISPDSPAAREGGNGRGRSSRGVGSVFSQRQPFGGEPAAIGREPLVQYVRGENAVDAEMTKVVAQLAPRADERHVDIVGHRNRPNPPLRVPTFFVDIGNGELAGFAYGAAQLR